VHGYTKERCCTEESEMMLARGGSILTMIPEASIDNEDCRSRNDYWDQQVVISIDFQSVQFEITVGNLKS